MDYATSTFEFCITLQYAHFLSSSTKEEYFVCTQEYTRIIAALANHLTKTIKHCKIEIHIMTV